MGFFMEKNCKICDNVFNIKPSHYKIRFCCSKKCQNINQKNKKGFLNNNYKGGPKTQICQYCNIHFIPKNAYQKRKFCSKKCSILNSVGRKIKLHVNTLKAIELKKQNGINNPKKKCECGNKKDIKSKNCKFCFKNKILKNYTCIVCNNKTNKSKIVKTCSKKCNNIYLKNKVKGKNNPNWKGGILNENKKIRSSEEYKIWRNNVFIRDNFQCQDCNKKGGNLHAHHIKSFSKFKELRFDINNGLTLCFDCHKKLHNNMNIKPKKTNNIILTCHI